MREIKFRAWDKVNKKMIIVDRMNFSNHRKNCASNVWSVGEYDSSHNVEANVMQFTGLKDKNGKEIYEGDIIRCSYLDNLADVKYDNLGACFTLENTPFWRSENDDEIEFEIIGNIHENPELLKG